MTVIFLRTLIIFVTLVIVMRIMGKRQIGEMQPFEFVVTLIIADLACIPMADISIPLFYGIVSIICLFFLHQLLSVLGRFTSVKKVISGNPSLVINKQGVNLKELKKNNLKVDDLIESMRSAGYFSLDDVYYAIFESNGKLSVMPNAEKKESSSSLPLLVIDSGKIQKGNSETLILKKEQLYSFLTKNNIKTKNVEVMTVDGNGRVYLKEKNENYKILNMDLRG